uniref:Reverse transcriptase domain-containing protein n=1 Tax=Sinocyclocheilus rhinocerous TaxID=307959 RepID=A0A673J0D1_9TELE
RKDSRNLAVVTLGSMGQWFRTTVSVRQGCLRSPILFNIYLERIMKESLENHGGTVSIGGRNITNLRFADDIDGLACSEAELATLVKNLDEASSRFGMEISAEKTKLMTNSDKQITTKIEVRRQELEMVSLFKYLGAIISEEGSKTEVLARTAQTTAVFLYACESWTLTVPKHCKAENKT